MTSSRRFPALFAAALCCFTAEAQVTSLEGAAAPPGGAAEGIISDLSAAEMTGSQFLDWSETLGEFSDIASLSETTLQEKIAAAKPAADNTGTVMSNGQTLRLPSAIDENGVDLYMLTREGITVYMAILSPAFYQETTDDIVRWVRYWAYDNREKTRRIFERYTLWEDYIGDTFAAEGVPRELGTLCIIESACTYRALSKAGALGMWQLMDFTARDHGMRADAMKDERTDPAKSTRVAAKVLSENRRMMVRSYDTEDAWTLATAGYNCGMGRVMSHIRAGGATWSSIKPLLPRETQQYIPSLIAVNYVWSYRKQLGF